MDRVLLSTGNNSWGTPQKFFDRLNQVFRFTLDPCADENNHKCDKFYTVQDDGLSQNWGGGKQTLLKDNQLDSTQANILQIDIENAEWEMLENINIETLAQNFAQVIFEFHGCNPEEKSGFHQRITQLRRLDKHFCPIHLHFNNHGKIFYSRGLFFSTSIEVSYINRKCLKDLGFNESQKIEQGILKDLDSPTWLANPEIPIRFS